VLLAELVATSAAVAATSSRTAKRDALADLLRRVAAEGPGDIDAAVGFLTGEPRQGRIGVGWRTLEAARPGAGHAAEPTLTIHDLDAALDALAGLGGAGSGGARVDMVGGLLARATEPEAAFVARLIGGELRQGALEGVMTDAVAAASGVPATVVRRAVMLGGRLDVVARVALTEGRSGLESIGLVVGRPVQPMLASTAASVTEALADLGEAAVEWKLDGIRIQAHRDGDDVAIYTRNLNDITARLPEVVEVVRSLPAQRLVLDGEALVVDASSGRPVAFQDTASRVGADEARADGVQPFFFDVLHVDGRDLLDEPLAVRRELLAEVTGPWRIPGSVTAQPDVGEAVLASALAAGHEGVVVKATGTPYEAGRRGKGWRKVKPVHTLDLVVLAAEWGHGRRRGWLSNLHLGARADDGSGFVMVGKTFKGLTDALLAWQTERFLSLAEREEPWGGPQTGVVWLRPEQVVEIALDGVQRSTRYPGGVALRFARVVRYRDDKPPAEADTLAAVQAMLPA
jgi:DNA ligase-1